MSTATVTKVAAESSKHRTQAVWLIVFTFTGLQFSKKALQNFVKVRQWNILQLPRHLSGYSPWFNLLIQVLVERFVFLLKLKLSSLFNSTESPGSVCKISTISRDGVSQLGGAQYILIRVYFDQAYQCVHFIDGFTFYIFTKFFGKKALWTALLPFLSDR